MKFLSSKETVCHWRSLRFRVVILFLIDATDHVAMFLLETGYVKRLMTEHYQTYSDFAFLPVFLAHLSLWCVALMPCAILWLMWGVFGYQVTFRIDSVDIEESVRKREEEEEIPL